MKTKIKKEKSTRYGNNNAPKLVDNIIRKIGVAKDGSEIWMRSNNTIVRMPALEVDG